ncbi:protein PIN-LIKES 1-like isoform X3 [Mangifera indica]|uniref:protein PIN-LIKES 1-like isoform X3 n=1 Tax=Mangifera indica TaxID=29780 RepID=UPI001CFA5B71|nr:protein PIN-LIKES 1-like isoform X3 [Mangifera indica]
MRAYAKNETSHSTSIKSPGETLENFTQVLLPSSGDYSEIEREKGITLIIGANLLKGLKGGGGGGGVGASVIIGILTVKYIIMPPLGIGVVKAARHFGFVESNSLSEFSLMLQYYYAVGPD